MTDAPPTPSPASTRRVGFAGLLESVLLLASLATAVSWAGSWYWLCELASHFRVQLTVVFGVLLLLHLVVQRRRLALTLCVVGLVANAGPVLWATRPTGRLPNPHDARLRVLSVNVHTANQDFAKVRTAIETSEPDLLVLQEVDDRWMAELAPLERLFPHRLDQPREDNFGLAVWSRYSFQNSEILEFAGVEVPALAVSLTVAGTPLRVLAVHLLPPGDAEYADARNRQLRAVAEWTQTQQGPLVVVGDFNATPWSPFFQDFLRYSRVGLGAAAWSLNPTWPAGGVGTVLLRIPLDHCLVSPDLAVLARQVGPDIGSDHFPLQTDLAIPSVADGATRDGATSVNSR
ncbi:MAG: endonuclease/exonuclease/phosphatase family protein [Verrucomicrobia bacterium]|nr:endonuclease/exonuclease/phosphatase family protein [Verrucomicrobiota bacterium]